MKLCDRKCNICPIVNHSNSRMVTRIMNEAYDKFGKEFYHIVQSNCPNLTCCFDCQFDNFCHIEGCKIVEDLEIR